MTQTGNFWGQEQMVGVYYMQATYALLNWYWFAALQSDVRMVWEKVMFYVSEHLRLGGPLDIMEARWRAPFFLLSLNRDDDAFSFIRYWAQLGKFVNPVPKAKLIIHKNSKEGDWIFPREADCRFSDVSQIPKNKDLQEVELPFLVALLIIKLRIVAAHDAALQSIEKASQGGESCVRDDIDSQRKQVEQLMDAIDQQNSTMLPAIINLVRVRGEPSATAMLFANPSDAELAFSHSTRCFQRIPGALDLLKKRYG